jgi:N-acetylated-alpha-linked acidic dipeptidase
MKKTLLLAGLTIAFIGSAVAQNSTQQDIENAYKSSIYPSSFKTHLQRLTERPHVAGSENNKMVQDYIYNIMDKATFKVEQYPYDVYIPATPGVSLIEIVTPKRQTLTQQEDILKEDPFSSDTDLWKGWNSFSGSGDVTAEVVYVNYGTREDFQELQTLGISVAGKIVLARYGKNFRGYKAKFSELNGAAGLIIYTDPKDNGYATGLTYPEGPYFNESTIQRGSLLTVDYTGDPLTPYEPALPLKGKKKVKRLDPSKVGLHTIPVLPISYGEAQKIMQQMQGDPVPAAWQGGLPFTYRIQGGTDLKLRIKVDQPINYTPVANIVGTLKGAEFPDEWIILGCHFDAWGFGATDPNSGTAMLLSLSESLGRLAAKGYRPKRSIMIAHWDAEEHGVIGSSEWVEQMGEVLGAKAIAYMNFDGGVSGKNFGASASPTLKQLIIDASKSVNYPYNDQTLYEFWKKPEAAQVNIGNLGGGSDHIAFYMHVGVPSLSAGAGGPTPYHSNYDSFHYYSTFVDPEFKMGPTIEHLAGLMALRLSNKTIIDYDINRYAIDLKTHFSNATNKVKSIAPDFVGFLFSQEALLSLEIASKELSLSLNMQKEYDVPVKNMKAINAQLIALEKSFIEDEGMDYGAWYRSLYASTDPFSGYASWMLPGIEYEVALKRSENLGAWDIRYAAAIDRLAAKMNDLNSYLSSF